MTCSEVIALDVTVQQYKESPGLYYDFIGEVQLYNTEWKIVTYINLETVDNNFKTVENYAQMSVDFCKKYEHKVWVNYTGCLNTIRRTDGPLKEVRNLRSILTQLTRNEDEFIHARNKRGVFNFIGGISKILFGTLDAEDASYYTDKISQLENEQLDFLKLSKEQMTVVKSTLRSINSTLLTVSENEKRLSVGLEEMAKHINAQSEEIREIFGSYSLILTINEHSMQLGRAIDECRREYEILIDAVVNAHKGVMQPQLITPAQIFEQVKLSHDDMPSDLSLPVPTSATYQYLLLRIVSIDVFLQGAFLVYVIRLPLTNNVSYNLYHVLPFPIRVKGTDSKFIFIQPEHSHLLMDTAKRFFTRLGVDEVNECKTLSKGNMICKQTQPVQLTHLDEECEAQMIQTLSSIPSSCSQRIVELNQTLWTQLDNNEWLYVAPKSDVLTVLCNKHEPTDVRLLGTGKLKLNGMCKAYGSRILIQSHSTLSTNRINKDFIPSVSLEYDCCDNVNQNFKLNELHLHVPLRSVTRSLDDLRVASHKVEDVESLISEQEWKIKHSIIDSHLSFLSYVGMVTTCLTLICLCYFCCVRCCCKRCPKFSKWWDNHNPCTTIVVKPKIVNSIHSSRESLRCTGPRGGTKTRHSVNDAVELTELDPLSTHATPALPAGKR